MRKIVINTRHGGFGLSNLALDKLGKTYDHYYTVARDGADLVRVVEELGSAADGPYARLKVVEIPEDVSWHIAEYDGVEWVAEDHRKWE